MKFILMGLFALVLTSGAAHAGWNITQQSDGSTVWTDDSGEKVSVGNDGLTFNITDLSTAATFFGMSNRDGKIKKVYVITNGAFDSNSAASDLSIGTGPGNAVGTFTPISVGASANSEDHITLVTTTAGYIHSFTPADVAVDVSQGGVISVRTDGDGTGTVSGTVIIIIE